MTKPYTIIRRFLFELVDTISLDGNYWEVINLLFALPGLYLNILKTEEILQFWDKKILDVRGTSFQRKRIKLNRLSTEIAIHFYISRNSSLEITTTHELFTETDFANVSVVFAKTYRYFFNPRANVRSPCTSPSVPRANVPTRTKAASLIFWKRHRARSLVTNRKLHRRDGDEGRTCFLPETTRRSKRDASSIKTRFASFPLPR